MDCVWFGGWKVNRRICPHCQKNSYSAYDGPDWICPYCGKAMKHIQNEHELFSREKEVGEVNSSKLLYFRRKQNWKFPFIFRFFPWQNIHNLLSLIIVTLHIMRILSSLFHSWNSIVKLAMGRLSFDQLYHSRGISINSEARFWEEGLAFGCLCLNNISSGEDITLEGWSVNVLSC